MRARGQLQSQRWTIGYIPIEEAANPIAIQLKMTRAIGTALADHTAIALWNEYRISTA